MWFAVEVAVLRGWDRSSRHKLTVQDADTSCVVRHRATPRHVAGAHAGACYGLHVSRHQRIPPCRSIRVCSCHVPPPGSKQLDAPRADAMPRSCHACIPWCQYNNTLQRESVCVGGRLPLADPLGCPCSACRANKHPPPPRPRVRSIFLLHCRNLRSRQRCHTPRPLTSTAASKVRQTTPLPVTHADFHRKEGAKQS